MMLLAVTVTHSDARCYIDWCDCCSMVTPMFLPGEGPSGRGAEHRAGSLWKQWVKADSFCNLDASQSV